MWDGYIGFYNKIISHDLSAWYVQHNEHRLIFSRLLFWIDLSFFSGNNIFLLVIDLLIHLATLLLFIFLFLKDNHKNSTNLIFITLIFSCGFSWIQWENFTWAFQSQFFGVYCFAFFSFYFLYEHKTKNNLLFFIGSLFFAALSVISMANGIIVFPILMLLGVALKIDYRKITIIIIFGLLCAYFYFSNYTALGPGKFSDEIFHRPLQMLLYIAKFLGAPAGRGVAAIFGFLIMAFSCAGLFVYFKKNTAQVNYPILYFSFLLFIGGSALGAAGNRLVYGLDQAFSSRYTTPAIYAWIAIFLLWTHLASNRKALISIITIFSILTLSLVGHQRHTWDDTSQREFNRKLAVLAAKMNVHEDAITSVVYPDVDTLISQVQLASQNNISIFQSDWLKFITESPNFFESSKKEITRCNGEIETYNKLSKSQAIMLTGWSVAQNGDAPKSLAIINQANQIVGYAVSGEKRPSIFNQRKNGLYSGWKGFIAPAFVSSTSHINVYGILGGNHFCIMPDSLEIDL